MTTYYVGQKLRVGTTLPEPPKHHTRKWREWEDKHYLAKVVEIADDRLKVEDLDRSNQVATFCFYIFLNDSTVTLTPEPDEKVTDEVL